MTPIHMVTPFSPADAYAQGLQSILAAALTCCVLLCLLARVCPLLGPGPPTLQSQELGIGDTKPI